MSEFIRHSVLIIIWLPLVLFYMGCALRERMRGDADWERHYLLLSQIWMAAAIIIGSMK